MSNVYCAGGGAEVRKRLVDAERRIEARIAERVPPGLRRDLEHLLEETVDAGVTRFVWLRQFEPGNNSADANRLRVRRVRSSALS